MRRATEADLEQTLQRIDGRGYKAYQDLRGCYHLGAYELEVAHVQGDPYAPPSRVHLRLGHSTSGFGDAAEESAPRRLGVQDFLTRAISAAIRDAGSREIGIDRPGQEMLSRSAVRLHDDHLEARLSVQLPAAGRRILGRQAASILLEALPAICARSLERRALDEQVLRQFQDVAEDHTALITRLAEREWVAFVACGARLPRRAGHDDRPLEPVGETPVIAFEPPETLAAEIDLPHAGRIRGMAIPRGVTLLVGGGFHGKSTLLEAISRGIYPHIPGDGRERVATDPRAVKVRAEDGRAVTGTDISAFIGDLPYGRSTRDFSTTNASGSTSQAANIVEALEAGARLLLLDEDTSATNFMIRDEPMRRLLRPGQEPITPFLDRVRNLFRDRGVSTILVVGGSGEYFRVADRVIQMDRYRPRDVTAEARRIAPPGAESPQGFPPPGAERRLRLDAYRRRVGPRGPRIKAPGTQRLLVEREEVDLGACEQLVSSSQTRTLAEILGRLLEGERAGAPWDRLPAAFAPEQIEEVLAELGDHGFDAISRFPRGDLAAVRAIEVLAMINRLRSLGVDR